MSYGIIKLYLPKIFIEKREGKRELIFKNRFKNALFFYNII